MFHNIFIGVDGTPSGRDAIALAVALAAPDAALTLVNIHDGDLRHLRDSNVAVDVIVQDYSLRLLETERDASGVTAELLSAYAPSVGRGLHTVAEEHASDLLVVGSCVRGHLGKAFIGDDTRAALNGAPCAIAVAPHSYAAKPAAFVNIGVGYDFSIESNVALDMARRVAAKSGASIRAMYVLTPRTLAYGYGAPVPGSWGEILEEDRLRAQERLWSLEGIDGSAVYGVVADELAGFSEHVELLVVGSRNYGPVRRLVLGSTSDQLARHSHCPLLVLPRAIAADQPPAKTTAEAAATG